MDETFRAADKAERDIEAIEDALYHLREVKEALEGSETRTADFMCSILDMIETAEAEKSELEQIVSEADARESRAADREYWEARL